MEDVVINSSPDCSKRGAMDPSTVAVDYRSFTDERLLDLLLTEEDRLTRAAVDEFVARGERMVEPLTRILQEEESWSEMIPAFWRPVHATFILGAIGGERVVPALLTALQHANDHDIDWISERLPSIFAAVASLLRHSRETDPGSYARWDAFRALAGIAARHPDLRDDILGALHAVAANPNEPDFARIAAACELLDFARPGDRELLMRVAEIAEREKPGPLFDRQFVLDAYAGKTTPLGFADWLAFYSPKEIEMRQQRWREEDAQQARQVSQTFSSLSDGSGSARPSLGKVAPVGRNNPCPCGSGKKFKKCCAR